MRITTGTPAHLLCGMLGHDCFTIGRTIRTRKAAIILDTVAHAPIVRHELRHVYQQNKTWLVWWLVKYLVVKKFRLAMEAEARLCERAAWPQFRVAA